MKRLIIFSHPSKNSFNFSITKKIIEISQKNNIEIDFLDLYEKPQNFLRYENQKNIDFEPQRENIQKRISEADELIFVYPIWWNDVPAILKNFFDQNFSSWFAFKYIDWKPKWLLEWKSARVFCTAAGNKDLYEEFYPHKKNISHGILEYCGLSVKNFSIFGSVRSSNENWKYLDEIEKILN